MKINLHILAQNCQSFNVSTKCKKTSQKISTLLKTGADILMLSDLKLNSSIQNHVIDNIMKQVNYSNYEFIYNSPYAVRGVGIMYKKSLGLVINRIRRDRTGNVLGINCNIDDKKLTLISIYGPNDNSREFYVDVTETVRDLHDPENLIVIGGDWNSTWDCNPAAENIDVINMQQIPSRERSLKVKEIAENFDLTDPFRFLYPNCSDFTYIPNAQNNTNRSRIDKFLVNTDNINSVKDCTIGCNRLTTMFDHKPINLILGNNKRKHDLNKISDTILSDNLTGTILGAAVREAYLNHVDRNSVPSFITNPIKIDIGRMYNFWREADQTEYEHVLAGTLSDVITDRILELRRNAADILESLPDLEFFENLPLSCEPDLFFEGLIMSLKNEILAKQSKIFKLKRLRKDTLRKELITLKKDYLNNSDQIFLKERQLDNLIECDLKEELLKYEKFHRLNDEKITPYFINLVKQDSNSKKNLNVICDNDGREFTTDPDRDNYISEFYRNLYKKPDNDNNETNPLPDNVIEDFLGDAATHPAVANSKLTDPERERLEIGLKIEELDRAVRQIKKNSSPGIDGISNKFIKKYWTFFRVPLYRYALCCFENGRLTDSFRTAKIRLIPKKGNLKNIANWRPISLLNCFYKVLSRVFTNRLRPHMHKITGTGQHGYSNKKFAQEVLITLTDGIYTTKKHNKTAAIVSLDIKKAFDSLSHRFIDKALKFFNMGPQMIAWIKLLCTNRRACIILGNEKLGSVFNLERGNAQGDVISPFLFNICYQIVLLKLELDLQIKDGLDLPVPVPVVPNFAGAVEDQPPVRYIAKRVFAFADDCNVFCKLERASLLKIKEILASYGEISGLICNVSKSSVLCIGDQNLFPENLTETGFDFSDSLTVLGLEINNTGNIAEQNGDKIKKKIADKIRTWSRFKLSLPGRIGIAKSMLYSQINYLGNFLLIPEYIIQEIEQKIANFVSGNLRIAYDRIFLNISLGGLGMFKIKQFLYAQRCAWVKKSVPADQIWKLRLEKFANGNFFTLNEAGIDFAEYPCTFAIAEAYSELVKKFTGTDRNFEKSFVYGNKALTIGIRSRNFLTHNEHDLDNADLLILKNLTIRDLWHNGNFVSKRNFVINTNLNPNNQLWTDLDKIRRAAVHKYNSNSVPGISLSTFFDTWKRGSKKVRNILCKESRKFIPHNIIKFSNTIDLVIDLNVSRVLNKLWNRYYFSNSLRTFIFKLHNNTLVTNTVLSNFVRGLSRNCTFCNITGNQEPEDETILHLFFTCRTVEPILENFYSWVHGNNEFIVSRRNFFTTPEGININSNEILLVINHLVMKYLWEIKLRKNLPVLEHLKTYVLGEINVMRNISASFNNGIAGSGFLNLMQ
jgi:exonuclease III